MESFLKETNSTNIPLMENDVGASSFSFAFNNPKFSDGVLSIEIIPDTVETQPNDSVGLSAQIRKRSRDGVIINQENGEGTSGHCEEHTINFTMPDVEDNMASENQDRDGNANIEESVAGNEANRSKDLSTVLQVKTVQINSAILAVKSPFFYKLFSNGMRESERGATLRIYACEEASLMDLLNFMYCNTLSSTTVSSLLDILMVADKFDVASCMQYCSQQLGKLPMTCDLALSYMDLPPSVLQAVALQKLTHSAKQFITVQFRDINKFKKQLLNLSLAGIEAIFSSDDIQVFSEDVVYDLVLQWAKVHYPQLEERRGLLETRLRHLIRFPYMSRLKLKRITTSTDFSPEVASEIVLDALFFKTETPYRQHQRASGRHVASENIVNTDKRFVERAYMCRQIKAVELQLPRHHCVVYLDLKREECERLILDGWSCSEAFHLGKQGFHLSADCCMDVDQNILNCFGLFLKMHGKESDSFAVDYEFAAWSREEGAYKTEFEDKYTFTGGDYYGVHNLFDTTWEAFIADDSPYFFHGVLHLRAIVSVQQ